MHKRVQMGQSKARKIVSHSSYFNTDSFTREKVNQMLKFIIEMPPEGCSHTRGHTMPFVANEIFNCEMASISQKFFTPAAYASKDFTDL